MSNPLDLTGTNISATYPRLVQVKDGVYYDGLGATLDLPGGSASKGPQGFQGFQGPQGISGDLYKTSSNTTLYIPGAGDVIVITTQTDLAYTINQQVLISYDSTNYFKASVLGYNPNTGQMTLYCKSSSGSGSYSTWSINLDGAAGGIGPQGPIGPQGSSTTVDIAIVEGGINEIQNPFSDSILNVINGGYNSVRELGSFSTVMIVDTNF